jgi:hydrogenase maturation protease
MTGPIVVTGVGNEYRRDDGVGPALIAALAPVCPTGVTLGVADGEPTQLLDVWAGAGLAVVVDAVLCEPSTPGRIHRTTLGQLAPAGTSAGTHGLGIPDAIRLAEVLGRAPARLVVFAVEAADLGFGVGLSPAVAAALPGLAEAVLAEITTSRATAR